MAKNEKTAPEKNTDYSLNDDRRVKVLSPGALVAKRFFRNRLAVTGLVILVIMFVFSFLGGVVSPYKQDQKFYRTDIQKKDFAGVLYNQEYRYTVADSDVFSGVAQANAVLAVQRELDSYDYEGTTFTLNKINDNYFTITANGKVVSIASKDVVSSSTSNETFDFEFTYKALNASVNGDKSFDYDGKTFTIDKDRSIFDEKGEEYAYISQYIVRPVMGDIVLSRDFKNKLIDAVENNETSFIYTDEQGVEAEYIISFDASKNQYNIKQEIDTTVFDTYAEPTSKHWLGTDRNGMDMLTRLMYGGRVSLIIGFIVVFLETFIGVIFGGISGYFGGRVDNLMMRIVDIFYCIPSMPIIIILGAAMDAANLEPSKRMLMLMIVLGVTGWPGIARLVRGQILSLREQEFMTATEACGISVSRRIFKHLIPNVIPQLIVTMTMGLGGTIITEATLSFLGLGVRFPFASWGNIINDVNNVFVLTHYWNIWIPAGILLLLTVLAFNIVGDGLRDAFDPKMKR
ncbi:MAG: ABC transporter permease [Ruminococcaceae bacterium]|jgi:peptide/nickel transport system permease protein|nr:ABC transporter permease [Oscillospiraceae bacterium]